MADRVSATITIGGTVPRSLLARFIESIQDEGLSVEWDGGDFEEHELPIDNALYLVAHEVPWGRFEQLEAFCVEHGLPFVRWSGGFIDQWDPERVVFTGTGEPQSFGVSEDDDVRIGRHTAEALGSFEAIIANFDAADFTVPPLIIVD